MRKYLFVLIFILRLSLLLAARKALVIGNSNYPMQSLRTPVNDAEEVAGVLGSLDFQVHKHTNVSQAEMMRVITEFSEQLDTVDEVVFYFAGHGIQIDGNNYLMPVSPSIMDKYDAVAYSYSINLLLEKLSRPGIVVVFLDACRNNPYSWTRSLQSGLAGIEPVSNRQYIISSTKAGSQADDGNGRNSPFAEALIKHISDTIPVEELARDISAFVEKATNNQQTPSVYGNLPISYSLAKQPELKAVQSYPPSNPEAQIKPPPADPQPSSQAPIPRTNQGKNYGILEVLANMDGDLYLNNDPKPAARVMQNTLHTLRQLTPAVYRITLKTLTDSQTQEVDIPPNQVIKLNFVFDKTLIPTGFRIIPGGSFEMGSTEGDEKPIHKVMIDPIYMSYTELTVGEFKEFVTATGYLSIPEQKQNAYSLNTETMKLEKHKDANWRNPKFEQNDRHPVTCVSWYDAIAYCNWRSAKEGLKPCYHIKGNSNPPNWRKGLVECNFEANGFRLPTEAEWEYAARAGNPGHKFSGGNEIAKVAVHYYNSQNRTWEVASKASNSFGIYDLTGNVAEWCWDWYDQDYYSKSDSLNPKGPSAMRKMKLVRGGAWYDDVNRCSLSFRYPQEPDYAESGIGFRLVQVAQ